MRNNPVIPYALIAVIGIALMLVMSFIGLNQQKDIAEGDNNQGAVEENEKVSGDPAEIYSGNCQSCHGGNLEGGLGPALAGTDLSHDDLVNVITNGRGGMPAFGQKFDEETISKLADWILEQ